MPVLISTRTGLWTVVNVDRRQVYRVHNIVSGIATDTRGAFAILRRRCFGGDSACFHARVV